MWRTGCRDDHIGQGQPLGQTLQRESCAPKGRSRVLGFGKCAVDHLHTACAPVTDRFQRQPPHLPRADDQHPPLAQIPRVLLGQGEGHGTDAGRIGADGRLVARPLAGADGCPEELGQAMAQHTRFRRLHKGVGYLSQNLGFAQHQRIQAGGDPQQVGDRVPTGADVEMFGEFFQRHTCRCGQHRRQLRLCQRRIRRRTGVEFQPVAGGEQGQIALGRADKQLVQVTGQPFPHFHGRRAVIDAETENWWVFHRYWILDISSSMVGVYFNLTSLPTKVFRFHRTTLLNIYYPISFPPPAGPDGCNRECRCPGRGCR